jgi:hypothetical protein
LPRCPTRRPKKCVSNSPRWSDDSARSTVLARSMAWSGRCETEVGSRFCDVEFEHLEAVLVRHCPSCTLVYHLPDQSTSAPLPRCPTRRPKKCVSNSPRWSDDSASRFCDVEFEHLEAVLVRHCPSCTLVYPHRVPCETLRSHIYQTNLRARHCRVARPGGQRNVSQIRRDGG